MSRCRRRRRRRRTIVESKFPPPRPEPSLSLFPLLAVGHSLQATHSSSNPAHPSLHRHPPPRLPLLLFNQLLHLVPSLPSDLQARRLSYVHVETGQPAVGPQQAADQRTPLFVQSPFLLSLLLPSFASSSSSASSSASQQYRLCVQCPVGNPFFQAGVSFPTLILLRNILPFARDAAPSSPPLRL